MTVYERSDNVKIVCSYFILFMMYSFLGWLMETIVCSIPEKRIVNRGFLIGPYCPIYGAGALMIVLILEKYMQDSITLFIMAMLICSLLEYFTSYMMEKIFKARWWDYSDKKMNINGRICLTNSLAFGIIGVLLMYYVNPYFVQMLECLSNISVYIISSTLFVIFAADYIISSKLMLGFADTLISIHKDNTEEITQKIKEILREKSIFTKRIADAFPDVKIKIDNIKKRINIEKENLRKEVEKFKNKMDKSK